MPHELQKELFKELNAHYRACDNKSIAVNASYLLVMSFLYVNLNAVVQNISTNTNRHFSDQTITLCLIAVIIIASYLTLFVQVWFRGWKCHYFDVMRGMYEADSSAFGSNVPKWLKEASTRFSWDVVLRSVPALYLLIVFGHLAFILSKTFNLSLGLTVVLLVIFLLLHGLVSWLIITKALDVERYSA
jgi:hypothetical protein